MSKFFPYPLPKTLGIGAVDPMDFRYDAGAGRWVLDPGWWRRVGRDRKEKPRGKARGKGK